MIHSWFLAFAEAKSWRGKKEQANVGRVGSVRGIKDIKYL